MPFVFLVHSFGGKIGILWLRLVESMRTYMEQKVQPFAFGCSFEPRENFWIIFCLEKSNPPWAAFFPVCKALALSCPGPAMEEPTPCAPTARAGSDARLSSLQAEPAPQHTQIKTIPSPMAFGAGSQGNTRSCLKIKSQVFKFHTFCSGYFPALGKGHRHNPRTKTHRTKTISVVPVAIWTPKMLGSTQEL